MSSTHRIADFRLISSIATALTMLGFLLPCGPVRAQPSHVTRLGNFGGGEGEVQAVYAAGTIVYFAVGRQLRLANFSDPKNPQTISTLELTESITDMTGLELSGQQHLAVVGGPRLFLVNVDDPFAPQSVGSIKVGGTCEGVVAAGTIVHLAAGERGYKIFDLANFPSPLSAVSFNARTLRS